MQLAREAQRLRKDEAVGDSMRCNAVRCGELSSGMARMGYRRNGRSKQQLSVCSEACRCPRGLFVFGAGIAARSICLSLYVTVAHGRGSTVGGWLWYVPLLLPSSVPKASTSVTDKIAFDPGLSTLRVWSLVPARPSPCRGECGTIWFEAAAERPTKF